MVGEAVIGKWEGDWYRGLVVNKLKDNVTVHFIDYGNSATLSKDDVRQATPENMEEPPVAIKCQFVGCEGDLTVWEEELEKVDFQVELVCEKLIRQYVCYEDEI